MAARRHSIQIQLYLLGTGESLTVRSAEVQPPRRKSRSRGQPIVIFSSTGRRLRTRAAIRWSLVTLVDDVASY